MVKTANAGKHVLVEKPDAVNTTELQAMLDACAANGVQWRASWTKKRLWQALLKATGHAREVAVFPKCTNVILYYVGRSVPTPGARLCG